jgi:dienelactone hydrolase
VDAFYTIPVMSLPGYERFDFSEGGVTKSVYRAGAGPAVVLIHELPGMVPECVELGLKIAAEGYAVYMPLLFGEPMRNYGVKPLLWPCIWKEFSVLSTHGASPAAGWLRALARKAFADRGGKGVAAIGMCFTGRFALSLMMDKQLIAPVLCQPGGTYSASALGIPEAEWDNAVARSKAEDIPVLAMRFEGDALCRAARFDTLREGFGERLKEVVVPGKKHSVLTLHFKDLSPADQDRVWGELRSFLSERLKSA